MVLMVDYRCIIASLLIGTVTPGCSDNKSRVLTVSTSVSITIEELLGIEPSINSFFLAPNHRALVATTFSGDAVVFVDVADAGTGKLVPSQSKCLPHSAWMSDSSSFLLYDAPDLLWGDLKLIDIDQLQPLTILKAQFVTSLLQLPSDRFVLFVESGEQFSAPMRWQPILYEMSRNAGFVSVGSLPTINSPAFGTACKCSGVDVIVTANYTDSGDLEAWVDAFSTYNRKNRSRPTKGATFDKDALTGNGYLEGIVASDDGTVVVTLWRNRDDFNESTEYLIIGRLELTQSDSQGSVLVSNRVAQSSPYKLSKIETDAIGGGNQRLAVVRNGEIVVVAAGEFLRVISADTGETLRNVSIPGCIRVVAGRSSEEVIVTTEKGFDVLRFQYNGN